MAAQAAIHDFLFYLFFSAIFLRGEDVDGGLKPP
jgi:hypothetical protein